MAKLVILRGLPASGKSTYAAQLAMKGFKRVNKDDLRMISTDGIYSKETERYINSVAEAMIRMALQSGLDVVSDNTNLNRYHLQFAKAICKDTKSELEIIDFDTPLETCLQRDLERTHGRVGKQVIMHMYNKYFKDGKFPEKG